jgi:hypothetical protein
MVAFASGIGIGLMYKKYEKELGKYMKAAYKKMNE